MDSTPPTDASPPSFSAWMQDPEASVFVIGEVGQAHDGSLGTAHAYIDLVARAGANAVKFQTHIAAAESSAREGWRVRFSPQDETRFDYWKRMEFSPDQWAGLRDHARDRGLEFLSSPFSLEAVRLLESLGVPAWKVASGEVRNPILLEAMLATGKPILLSSGMSPWSDLDAAVARIRQAGNPLAVFQCTTAYPCPPERLGLNLIRELRDRYDCPVGLSDHSGTPHPSLAATALGARMLEVHVTFSRQAFGPDAPASLTETDFRHLIEGVRYLETAYRHPLDKDAEATRLAEMRALFGQSLVAARDLEAGAVLEAGDLDGRKPGTGIPVADIKTVVGRSTTRKLARGEFLGPEDLA